MSSVNIRAAAVMFLCVVCWSTSGLFIKLTDWHPMVIICLRSAIAAAFMAAVHGKTMFSPRAKSGAATVFLGVNALAAAAGASAATKILYVMANKMTSPVNAIFLQHTAPIWAALAAGVLIRERLCRAQWAGVFLAGCGITVFFLDGLGSGRLVGDGIALLAGVCFALSMTALRSLKEGSPALALFCSHLIPVALGLPFLFIAPPALTAANIARVSFLGLIQIGVASLLYAYAIKRLPAVNAMLIAQLEPVLNPLWLFVFSGEVPSWYVLAGGVAIIAAVAISSFGSGEEKPVAAPRVFPLFFPIAGKRVLIIGGGNIALRRVRAILQFDCRIHIIAREVCAGLEGIIAHNGERVGVERRAFSPGDCAAGERPLFVVAATNSRAVNHAAAGECAAWNIPVSVADCKEESTFYFPAVVVHDTIIVGISSGGRDHGAVRNAAALIRKILVINVNSTKEKIRGGSGGPGTFGP
jgi:siroheme synthase-like protein